jgi:alanine dehydrogenase
MPGAVPRTSTYALTNATLPWVKKLAGLGARRAIEESVELESAANAIAGRLTCKAVSEAFGMPWSPPKQVVQACS